MKIIDVNTWNRKKQYENFISYTNPVFSVGTRLDVTDLVEYCKKNKKAFFSVFLFILTKCVNQVDEMRMRLTEDGVCIYDAVHPSYVVMEEDGSLSTCSTNYIDDFDVFYDQTRKDIASVKEKIKSNSFNNHQENDCLYISCLPWIDITSLTNPYNFDDKQQSSIPRIMWGKFVKNNFGRYEMGFDIAVHHALVDGFQVAEVIQKINSALENTEKFLYGGKN